MKFLIYFIKRFQIILFFYLYSCSSMTVVPPPICHKNLEINIKAVERLHLCGNIRVGELTIFFYQVHQLNEELFSKIKDIANIGRLKCKIEDFPGIVWADSKGIKAGQEKKQKITWEEEARFLIIVPQYCAMNSPPLIFVRNCYKGSIPSELIEKYKYKVKFCSNQLSLKAGELEIEDIKSE